MNSPPILEPILVVGLVDVHRGCGILNFGPWPLEFLDLRSFWTHPNFNLPEKWLVDMTFPDLCLCPKGPGPIKRSHPNVDGYGYVSKIGGSPKWLWSSFSFPCKALEIGFPPKRHPTRLGLFPKNCFTPRSIDDVFGTLWRTSRWGVYVQPTRGFRGVRGSNSWPQDFCLHIEVSLHSYFCVPPCGQTWHGCTPCFFS